MLIKLVQNQVCIGILTKFDNHTHTFTVGLIANIGDAFYFFQFHQLCNLDDKVGFIYHVRNLAAIVEALGTLSTSSAELNNTVAGWSGELFDALPIVTQSVGLLTDTKDAAGVAEESEPLTLEEAVSLAVVMQSLTGDIGNTLTTIEDAKPKFDKLLFGPIILINLKLQKKETDKLSGAVVEKVPEGLREVAQGMVDEVSQLFEEAIDAYSLDIDLPFELPF